MEVKIYYGTARDENDRPIVLTENGVKRFKRQGHIVNFSTTINPEYIVDAVDFGTSENGYELQLRSPYRDENGTVLFRQTIAEMPADLRLHGRMAADPYEFFEIAGPALGVYRVDVDGEVYWVPADE